MKKLIKLLFPKTYQAIYDEGYNQCWGYCNPDSDYDQYDDYPEDYYEEEDNHYDAYHPDYDEEARLHDEYEAQLIKEYEEDCRRKAQALAEIYLPKAPVLEIGDKVHLHSIKGMYTVTGVYSDSFAFRTKHDEKDSYAKLSDYKCHAGGIWNTHKGLK